MASRRSGRPADGRVHRGFHDVLGSIEIGFADFQVNDIFALLF